MNETSAVLVVARFYRPFEINKLNPAFIVSHYLKP
jgi:hypothetical protein